MRYLMHYVDIHGAYSEIGRCRKAEVLPRAMRMILLEICRGS